MKYPLPTCLDQPEMIHQLVDGYFMRPLKNKLYTHEDIST